MTIASHTHRPDRDNEPIANRSERVPCSAHAADVGEACWTAAALVPGETFRGWCPDRLDRAGVRVVTAAELATRKDREHRRARHRNKAA